MVDKITWKEIKVKYPQFAQKFQKEFEALFRSLGRLDKPYLTVEDIENIIAEKGEGFDVGEYEVSFAPWTGAQRIRSDVTQLVVQINVAGELENILRSDSEVYEFFKKLSETSFRSGHPVVKDKTVGWFRVDIIPDNKGRRILFIDEIQSDVVQTAEGMLEERGRYKEIKDELIERERYSREEIDRICRKLLEMFKGWMSEGLGAIIRFAEKVGIKWIGIHTRETKEAGSYIASIYDTVKREFGFREEIVDLEGIGSRKIGIRRAHKIVDDFSVRIAHKLVKLAEKVLELEIE